MHNTKLKFLLILAMASVFVLPAAAQAPCVANSYDSTKNLQGVTGNGFAWREGRFCGAIWLPQDTVKMAVKDSGAIAWKNGNVYKWTGYLWNGIFGGVAAGTAWLTTGNVVSPATQFLGSTNDSDVIIKRHGLEAGRFKYNSTLGLNEFTSYSVNSLFALHQSLTITSGISPTTRYGVFDPSTITAARLWTLPNATGTIALTSDIPGAVAPAGNYGNLQINRNGAFAAMAGDSLTVNGSQLISKANIFAPAVLVDKTVDGQFVFSESGGSDYVALRSSTASGAYTQTFQARNGVVADTDQVVTRADSAAMLANYVRAPIGTFSASSITNGGSISGHTLTLGVGDGTNPGMISTTTQTIAGNKGFSGKMSIGTATAPTTMTLLIPAAPTSSANYGTISLGSGAFDGSTSGKFVGSSSGTSFAINEVTGYSGNLIDVQKNGASKFNVDANGNITTPASSYISTGQLYYSNNHVNVSGGNSISIGTDAAGTISFFTSGTNRWQFSGNDFLPITNNASNIGSSSFQVNNGYFGGDIYVTNKLGIGNNAPTSTFQVNGSLSTGYVAKTANYTATISDQTIDFTSGTDTLTLPTAVGISGREYTIINSGAGSVLIQTTSSETISGSLTKLYNTQWAGCRVKSTNANWIIIATF